MSSNEFQLTRQELYHEIWAEPITTVAKRYGLSNVGLAKICRKHRIPNPPRGYWARKQAGQQPRQTPLPRPDDDTKVSLPSPGQPPDNEEPSELEKLLASERLAENRIKLAGNLRNAHPLVRDAREPLEACALDAVGLTVPPTHGLGIRVARKDVRRALLIMDALATALERRGYPVVASKDGLTVRVFSTEVTFSITESTETKREQPKDHDLTGRYSFGHSHFNEKQVLSGALTLEITGPWLPGSFHRRWRDQPTRRLEDRLNVVVAGILRLANGKRQHEIQEQRRKQAAEDHERRRAEQERRLVERQQAIAAEKARVESLLKESDRWKKSETLRQYIEAQKRVHLAEDGRIDPGGEFAAWLSWAEAQADRLDPLTESPPSILDDEAKLSKDIEKFNATRYSWQWGN